VTRPIAGRVNGPGTRGASVLQTRMQQQATEDRARAIRLLLARPLLTADADPDGFDLVRRHAEDLRRWFDDACGWTLHVEPRRGYARLVKVRPDPDPTRPARRQRSTRAPFDRRRYVMLCLICAELARPGAMTTVGLLAERVRSATTTDPAVPTFDTAHRDERAAFVDALKLLEEHGVVRAVDGSSDAYVDSPDAKVLYQVDDARLVRLLAAPVPPSRVAVARDTGPDAAAGGGPPLAALLHEARYGEADERSDEQRNRWLRHAIVRRVLDDPVVHFDDLTEAQRAYLATLSGRRFVREAVAATGMVLEERAEGLLAVDPDGLATDTRFPAEQSSAKHAALLLLDALAEAGGTTDRAALVARVEQLFDRHGSWARSYRSDGGPARLVDDAVDVLVAFGLARRDADRVTARPAAARYTTQEHQEATT
jgi:uncharacterized protein (TIGR02678 family)